MTCVLVPDHYPFALIKDVHDCMGGAAVFTTLDLKSGYWQLPVQESDRYKTAFMTPVGMFAFNVLPFGLCTAPSIFQRTMYLVLSGLKIRPWTCLYRRFDYFFAQ